MNPLVSVQSGPFKYRYKHLIFGNIFKNTLELGFLNRTRDGTCIEPIGIDLNRKEFSPNEDFDFSEIL